MLTRRCFLGGAATAAAALLTRPRRARAAAPPRNVIIVNAGGGWDTTYSIDPKPGLSTIDAPTGTVRTYGDSPVLTDPSRPNVATFFERHGASTAIINGFDVKTIVHGVCQQRVMTGSSDETRPDFGALAAHQFGLDLPAPYLVLGSSGFPGPYAGSAVQIGSHNQLPQLINPRNIPYQTVPAYKSEFYPTGEEDDLIGQYASARLARERATRGASRYNQARLDEFEAALDAGELLRRSNLSFGAGGGSSMTAAELSTAVQAIESGFAFAVKTDDIAPLQSYDTHSHNDRQSGYQDTLFGNLLKLADDLSTRPGKTTGSKLIDHTVVVVLSEMGRTPKLNDRNGKDHWPIASLMLFGAGVQGGRTFGGTDDQFYGKPTDLETGALDDAGTLLSTGNVVAGILELLGVDARAALPTAIPLRGFIAA
jgi:hypothetical protein